MSYRTSNDSTAFSQWKGAGNSISSAIGEQAKYLQYKLHFNTTDNAYTSILNNVSIVVDSTCPCPSSGRWVIQHNCVLDTACSMDGSNVHVASGGNLTINAGLLNNFGDMLKNARHFWHTKNSFHEFFSVFVHGNLFCRGGVCFG